MADHDLPPYDGQQSIPAKALSDEWYEACAQEMAAAMRRIRDKLIRIALGETDG